MIAKLFTCFILAAWVALDCVPVHADDAADLRVGVAAYSDKDYQTAIKYLLPLAIEGNAEAQYQIAQMHIKGHGVPANYCFSISWADKAARQNHSGAAILMSFAYFGGWLVKKDIDMAYRWAAHAFKLGHPNGSDHLEVLALAITPERRSVLDEEMKTWDATKQPTVEIFPFEEPELPVSEPYDMIRDSLRLRGCSARLPSGF